MALVVRFDDPRKRGTVLSSLQGQTEGGLPSHLHPSHPSIQGFVWEREEGGETNKTTDACPSCAVHNLRLKRSSTTNQSKSYLHKSIRRFERKKEKKKRIELLKSSIHYCETYIINKSLGLSPTQTCIHEGLDSPPASGMAQFPTAMVKYSYYLSANCTMCPAHVRPPRHTTIITTPIKS